MFNFLLGSALPGALAFIVSNVGNYEPRTQFFLTCLLFMSLGIACIAVAVRHIEFERDSQATRWIAPGSGFIFTGCLMIYCSTPENPVVFSLTNPPSAGALLLGGFQVIAPLFLAALAFYASIWSSDVEHPRVEKVIDVVDLPKPLPTSEAIFPL